VFLSTTNTIGSSSRVSSSFVQPPQSMAVEPYDSAHTASNLNAQSVAMDVELYGSTPDASDWKTPPVAMDVEPISSISATSASTTQLVDPHPSYGADFARGVLDMKPQYPMSAVAPGFPNYGDTVDYELDDDIGGNRNYLLTRGPVADTGEYVTFYDCIYYHFSTLIFSIDKFLIEAGNSEMFDGNESVDKALAKLGLKKLGEQLPLMSIALMPHQVIGDYQIQSCVSPINQFCRGCMDVGTRARNSRRRDSGG
jgi:hypothetical protein